MLRVYVDEPREFIAEEKCRGIHCESSIHGLVKQGGYAERKRRTSS
jgi:hypothetical protein